MPDGLRLLFILHQYGHMGGTEMQTRLLAQDFSRTHHVGVAWMDPKGNCAVLTNPLDGSERRWPTEPVTNYAVEHNAADQTLAEILREFRPDIVHFQHILYWPISAIDIALAAGAKVVISLYDYITITPDYAMEGGKDPRETFTSAYAVARFGSDVSGKLARRRKLLAGSLARAHRRVVISDYLRRVMSLVYPLNYDVIEPGIVDFQANKGGGWNGVRFGFLGSLIATKGITTLINGFAMLRERRGAAVELRAYGRPIPRGAPPDGLTTPGPFSPADLPRIFGEFDVGVIPSIYAETYSIVLSEMWYAGKPVIVSDLGAMGERVRDGINGRLVPPGNADALADAMEWFVENDSWRQWTMPKVRTAGEMVREHEQMYRELV